eukprot:120630_1
MSFFSKQAFDDDDDSDIDCQLSNDNNWNLQLNDTANTEIDITPQQHHQNIIKKENNINKSITHINHIISNDNQSMFIAPKVEPNIEPNIEPKIETKSEIFDNTMDNKQLIQSNQNCSDSPIKLEQFNNNMNEDDTDDDIVFDSSDSDDCKPIIS